MAENSSNNKNKGTNGGNKREDKFKYTIKNVLREPHFNDSITMDIEDGQPLIYYMKKAVDEYDELFKGFTVKYFGGSLKGYFIIAINDVSENYSVDFSYWRISTQAGPTPVGASHFIPKDGMEVTIELVKVCPE